MPAGCVKPEQGNRRCQFGEERETVFPLPTGGPGRQRDRLGVMASPLVHAVELGHAREREGACVWRLARAERAGPVRAGLDR